MDSEKTGSDALPREELRRRASAGLFVIGSWGLMNLLVGFGGSIVLARLLAPDDFGMVAIGMTLLIFGNALCEAGLGSGLIRRPEAPTRTELRAVVALQVILSLAIAIPTALIASLFGQGGLVVTVMVLALPLVTLQTPGRIMLERALLVRRVAMVDAAAMFSYYAWSIAGAAVGWGVWALATGAVVRVLAATLMMLRVSPQGVVLPSLRGVKALRPLIAFGIRFQGVSMTGMARDQGVNFLTGAIAGVATLGLWALARRLLELPLLLFEAVWKVSFPAMAHVLANEGEPAPILERSAAMAPIASGLVLTAMAASAPELVPFLFGEPWRGAAEVLPWACLALLIGGPVSVSALGYLYAAGRPGVVLRAAACHTVAWVVVTAALLPWAGVAAVGLGWIVASIVDATLMASAVKRLCGARLIRPLRVPVLSAAAAGATGWLVTVAGSSGIFSAILGGAVSTALLLALLLIFRRRDLLELASLVLRSARDALSRAPAVPAPDPEPAG